MSPQPILFRVDEIDIEDIQVNGDSHLTQHDQNRTARIDRTSLLQKILRSREGVKDQNRPTEDTEVVDVTFEREDISIDSTVR